MPDFSSGLTVDARGCFAAPFALGRASRRSLSCDALQAGIAAAPAIAHLVTTAPEWQAIVQSTLLAATAAAAGRRGALLRDFGDMEQVDAHGLAESLTRFQGHDELPPVQLQRHTEMASLPLQSQVRGLSDTLRQELLHASVDVIFRRVLPAGSPEWSDRDTSVTYAGTIPGAVLSCN